MKKYKLIANPAAGRGKARAAVLQVEELFRERGAAFDLELTTGPKQAAEIARAACKEFDVIVAVGGDGTVNEIVPAMLHSGKPLGIIPSGSGNDFIKALGIPNDIGQAVDIVLAGNLSLIDAGRINGTCFANAVGIGFDAAVNRASYGINHGKRGLWLYLCALVRTLGRYDPVRVIVSFGNEELDGELYLLTIGNGTTVGGGFKLTPHAKLNDGLLDMTIVRPLSIPTLLWHLPKVFLGTIERAAHHARLTRTRKLKIIGRGPIPVHVDGEIFEAVDHVYEIEVVPAALVVIRGPK
ncbi:MAG: diacylglycerol kinase family lipid kinase [Nitrospirota bacterium]|nr:diacylglycerol kinase family lipid kinase [Nitrospirota bacterium]